LRLKVGRTGRFKKDYKRALKQGKNIEVMRVVVEKLCEREKLAAKYKDHKLVVKFAKHRECHIEPDWLLIYFVDEKQNLLMLERLGSHAELFQK
jgi:mRNA interferase YafQ